MKWKLAFIMCVAHDKTVSYNKNVPLEVYINFLIDLPVDDLINACSSNKENRELCSSSFWKDKFVREGIPLLEEGTNFPSWLAIYTESIYAKRFQKVYFSLFDLFTRKKVRGF